VLGGFDRAADRWSTVTTARLLVTLVEDLPVRPERWDHVATALAPLPDPPATSTVSAHQVRMDPA
jgi:hypothetical protein